MAWSWPGALTYTGTELNIDKPAKASQIQKSRDREDYLQSVLADGLGAPQDLDINNLVVRGIATFASAEFPERALIFAGL